MTLSQLQTNGKQKESLEARLSAEKQSLQEKTVSLHQLTSRCFSSDISYFYSCLLFNIQVTIQGLHSQLQKAVEEQKNLEVQLSARKGILQQNVVSVADSRISVLFSIDSSLLGHHLKSSEQIDESSEHPVARKEHS